jgi:V/A-type H+-transporting ATPase subunit I
VQPPTQLPTGGAGRPFDVIVETYTTVPYRDVDPTLLAGLAYVSMFGMMFGDLGHGALLLVGALLVRSGRLPGRLGGSAGLRRSWLVLAGGGLASMIFGALYGEAFGPTGLVPVLWLDPLAAPVPMMLTAVGAGAVLIAGAYALGTVNRVREGGWGYALYARTGIAGSMLFLALAVCVAGLVLPVDALVGLSVLPALAGLGLTFVGLYVESGGGAAGALQAVVEVFDVVVRLGSNVVSFARLAAFGLTHAALGAVVWQATAALWRPGIGMVAAAAVFAAGNALTFTLEALVAGIQALRLEYYELFSRVFADEGRPFRPWRLPAPAPATTVPGSPPPVGSEDRTTLEVTP